MNNPDHIFESIETILCGSGMEKSGYEIFGSGNRDKNPGSATLDSTKLMLPTPHVRSATCLGRVEGRGTE
jgi:hypothetical protein